MTKTRMKGLWVVITSCLLMTSCAANKDNHDSNDHPNILSIAESRSNIFSIRSDSAKYSEDPGIQSAYQALIYNYNQSIDLDFGERQSVYLGEITKISFSSKGLMFALDHSFATIHAIDRDGHYIKSLGSPGSGPTELFRPTSFGIIGDSLLAVAQGNRTIKVLRIGAEYNLEFLNEFELDYNPESIEVCHDRLVVRGMNPSGEPEPTLIHMYNIHGELLLSWGKIYDAETSIMRNRLSSGRTITCDENGISIIYEYIPAINRYDNDGAVQWSAEVQDYLPIDIRMEKGRSGNDELRFGRPLPGMLFTRNVVSLPSGIIVLQSLRVQEGSRPAIITFLLNPSNGASGVIAESEIPWVYASKSLDAFAFLSTNPEPLITFSYQ